MSGNNPYRTGSLPSNTERNLQGQISDLRSQVKYLQSHFPSTGGHSASQGAHQETAQTASLHAFERILGFINAEENRPRTFNVSGIEQGYQMCLLAVKERLLTEIARLPK